jgi:hypothetical protein
MASKNRNTLLFVDQCLALQNAVKILEKRPSEFLPTNTTSVLQPINQGIIRVLKQKFHRSHALKLLQSFNSSEESYKLSLLNATSLLAMA